MSLKLGTTNINAMKLGATDIGRAMLGSTQIFYKNKVFLSEFDGTNDYLSRADLTGNADSKVFTISVWFSCADTFGTSGMGIYGNTNNRIYAEVNASGFVNIRGRDAAGNAAFDVLSTITVDDGQIHHLMASFNGATGAAHLYIDGVDALGSTSTGNYSVDYTETAHYVGSLFASGKLNGKIGQLYINTTSASAYIDLSSPTNRLKFWNSGPVNLGANGELPTGSSPIIFLNNPYTTFQTNLGTGGNFTVTGTLGDGGTEP